MEKQVLNYMRRHQMTCPGQKVLAGVSGGADSVCLLLVLHALEEQLKIRLTAVYVEHGIRGAASVADGRFVEHLCGELGIPFVMKQVDARTAAEEARETLEEAARRLRYQVFHQTADALGAERIAVAHHGEDCAETMLFHLARGTGLTGLTGIRPVREQIIRPLLCVSREEIEDYLAARHQTYVTDTTNSDLNYARNRIRHRVLPQLEQINSRAIDHMRRTAEHLIAVEDYLAGQIRGARRAAVSETEHGVRISCRKLGELHPVIRQELIHQLLGETAGSRKDITQRHIDGVLELAAGQTGRQISLPYQMTARRTYDALILEKNPKPAVCREPASAVTLGRCGDYLLPDGASCRVQCGSFAGDMKKIEEKAYTKWLDCDKIENSLQIRYRRPGDYLCVTESGGRKKLRDYFIDEKIPREKRDRILLLADGSHIIWVLGYRISTAYKVTEQTKTVLRIQVNQK
jgi:tRNA(Ile)-lysidine synthase